MTFGDKVKKIRKKKGLSQLELGVKMHVSQQAIAKFEKATEQPKLATVRKIADALDVTISELVDDWSSFTPEEIAEDISDTAQKGLNSLQTFAAHFDGDEYTEEELEEIRQFAEFVKSKRKDTE